MSDADTARSFELTDIGNGERLIHHHGSRLRYCAKWGRWLVWNCRRWEVDERGAVDALAKATLRDMKDAANRMTDSGRANDLWNHAHRSEANRKVKDMIERASKEPGVYIAPDGLDADPWLLNVMNGTLDLRTLKLRKHRQEDLITKLARVDYDPRATCPVWDAALDRIFGGKKTLIEFMRRAVGYTLTGITAERCFFILFGSGANGKSTFLAVLRELLGDYAAQTPADTLTAKRYAGVPNDVARLAGARFVAATETEEEHRLAESLVKRMTGGEDTVSARFMHGEWFDYQPAFKPYLATNHKPEIRGTDNGVWDRIRLSNWPKVF